MRKTVLFVLLLAQSIVFHVVFLRSFQFMPDPVIIILVFSAMFLPKNFSIWIALLAAIFKSVFSVQFGYFDIFFLPILALVVYLLNAVLLKYNVIAQGIITLIIIFLYHTGNMIYYDITCGAGLSVMELFSGYWKIMLSTAIAAPFCFYVMRNVLRIES